MLIPDFESFTKAFKDLKEFVGDSAHENPFIYSLLISSAIVIICDLKWIFSIPFFLLFIILFSWIINYLHPSLVKAQEGLVKENQANIYLSKITDKQKEILLRFFPYKNSPKSIQYNDTNYDALHDLIGTNILILIRQYDSFDTHEIDGAIVELTEKSKKIINSQKMFEKWKKELTNPSPE